ncbi:TonB-dependent receptor [Dyadobacter sp. CY323]|uniref:TonB-dependent receptor n=1 Tax=Dyadobacter sp. CY323 TaxID=2907302 RepID=UPI001F22AA6E|nr:TonB-dependent receptor [Dyadobacter sp. CY323]MCE6989839.1 TonB-dependent receptor [Dyadobacter sp. CY323]
MRISVCIITIVLCSTQLMLASTINGQSIQEKRIKLEIENELLRSALNKIGKASGFRMAYSLENVSQFKKVSLPNEVMSVEQIMRHVLDGTGLSFEEGPNATIVIFRNLKERNIQHHIDSTKSSIHHDQPIFQLINGKVTDEKGGVLPGVSIVVKGTSQGTTTDADGNFEISLQNDAGVLIFSFVGYISREIEVGTKTSLSIALSVDTRSLDELVVVGYGTVKKSDLTGSVSTIKGEEINSFPAANVMQALSGRASGVQVKQNTGAPGAGVSVRIRGTNSIQGSNEPLYVIDGFPSNGSPLILNNADIESIEVLKDASAIAIYGSRGANGVVLITTKSGKQGKMQVDYESTYGSQQLRKKLEFMNAVEYARFYNEQRINDGQGIYFTEDQINGFGNGFDWQDFVFQKAPIQNHSLNISAGNEKTQFSLSGSIFDQKGIIKGSNYKRYSLRTNIHHALSSKIQANFSSTLSRNITDRQNSSGARFGASLISASLVAPPTLTPYNENGTYRVLSTAYPFLSEGLTNPLNFINETKDAALSNKVMANASISYEPIGGLILKVYGGVENSDDRSDYYQTRKYVNSQGSASVSSSQFTSLLNENTISYTKLFGKHSLSALGGFTVQDFTSTSLSGSGTGFLSDVTETYNLASASIPGIPGSGYSKSVLLSYLGRLNYNFDNRVLATLSFRADGSSKYSEGNKWGHFPSAALAWRIKQEKFMENIPFITDLKLRTSWGQTGSQAINAYATLSQLSSGKNVFGNTLYNTFAPGTVLPGNLKWETTEQSDIGMDLAIMQNRIQITADYYVKNTRDLLNTVQLPSSLGYTSTIRNIGQIRNKGFEFSVNANLIDGAFKWDVNGNIAFNKTKVVKLYGHQDILGGAVDMLVFSDNTTLLREGEELGVFYGYLENGYNEKGAIQYQDINNDGAINLNDKTIIGNPNPDFIYGLNSTMSFKGLDLNLFLQGSQGNDIVNISGVGNTLHYGYGNNMLKEVYYNHWTPDNTNAAYPRITRTQTLNFANRFVENGSYLRLRNIELGYSLPLKTWGVNWIRAAKIYVSGQNLITFTKYSWWDPEVNSMGGANSIAQGIDFSTYPTAKSYMVGIRVNF